MDRLRVIQQTFADLSAVKAARILGLSVRQVFRVKARVRQDGPNGILHRHRGHTPSNAKSGVLRARVLALYQQEFADYNIAHFTEALAEECHISLSYAFIRRWLRSARLGPPRHRATTHRRRRPRRRGFGELLFLDGSPHHWFGPDRPAVTVVLATDDATGMPLYGIFAAQETLSVCFEVLYQVCRNYGIPQALYLDRASHFTTTRHGGIHSCQRDDQPTQFERALRSLSIEPIFAHSPQARGRGERINGSFQSRLVPELRRKGITDIAAATTFLNQVFIPKYQARFGLPPQNPKPAFRPLPKDTDLRTILCTKETRTVANDDTISYKGTAYQLLLPRRTPSLIGAKIELQEWFDGSIHAYYNPVGELPLRPLPKPPKNTPMTFSLIN